jgi:pentatricopeptide repeat protein
MLRVLQSRQQLQQLVQQETQQSSTEQRLTRPVIVSNDVDGAERVLHMLYHLQQTSGSSVDETAVQIVMRAFLNRGRRRWHDSKTGAIICAADQVSDLLEQLRQRMTILLPLETMEHRNTAGGGGGGGGRNTNTTTTTTNNNQNRTLISTETYNLVLQAYAVCSTPRGERNYAGRAAILLQRMQQETAVVPVESLQHVLRAYSWQQANMQEGDCAAEANRLLDCIEEQTDDPNVLMKCYDWVLEAWSKSGSAGSATKANALFEKMIELNATLAKTDDNDDRNSPSSSIRRAAAEQVLDAETHCNCILAWSKTVEGQGAEKAHSILLDMLDRYNQGAFTTGSEPLLIAFNGVIAAWARQGRADKAEEVLFLMDKVRASCERLVPDAVSYNSVLYAHLRSADKELGLQKALALVQYMDDHCGEQPAIRPNSFTYHTLLKCWIQSGRKDLAEQAEQILIKMEQMWNQGEDDSLTPNNRIFNMVINAYAKSKDRYAARKACTILQRMKSSQLPSCQPDVVSYTSVMECLSKSSDPTAPARVEELLSDMLARYNTSGNEKDRPNARTFTMAILTLAKSNGSAVRARALLTQLVELYKSSKNKHVGRDKSSMADSDDYNRPSEYAYNYVLNCAANTLRQADKLGAFQIATQTYQEMRHSNLVKPDSFTYAFWLKCCNNLLPAGSELRTKCVSYAFEECKERGLVSDVVLSRLFQGNPPSLVDALLKQSAAPSFSAAAATTTTTTTGPKLQQQQRDGFGRIVSPPSILAHQRGQRKQEQPYHRAAFRRQVKSRDLPRSWSRYVNARNKPGL